ncbi:MAG: hypothetical protein AB1668_06420 [Nanoarchaeota archaeon]
MVTRTIYKAETTKMDSDYAIYHAGNKGFDKMSAILKRSGAEKIDTGYDVQDEGYISDHSKFWGHYLLNGIAVSFYFFTSNFDPETLHCGEPRKYEKPTTIFTARLVGEKEKISGVERIVIEAIKKWEGHHERSR